MLLKLESPKICPSSFLQIETVGYYTSALYATIKAKLLTNISLLLFHGADPNELPLKCFSYHSVCFFCFRYPQWSTITFPIISPRENALAILLHPQTRHLTVEEVDVQRNIRTRFWAKAFMPAFGLSYNVMTTLESVAEIGNIQIFGELLNVEADIIA